SHRPLVLLALRPPTRSTLFPYTTLFRSMSIRWDGLNLMLDGKIVDVDASKLNRQEYYKDEEGELVLDANGNKIPMPYPSGEYVLDRKSTRLNSSHVKISYAVFCLKKKKQ